MMFIPSLSSYDLGTATGLSPFATEEQYSNLKEEIERSVELHNRDLSRMSLDAKKIIMMKNHL